MYREGLFYFKKQRAYESGNDVDLCGMNVLG